jgi:hypothetical protein
VYLIEVPVEGGGRLGAETSVVIAKGISEIHFAVILGSKRPHPGTAVTDG